MVRPDSHADSLDIECAHGIHYYLSLEPAYYNKLYLTNGIYKAWFACGTLRIEIHYICGVRNAVYRFNNQ